MEQASRQIHVEPVLCCYERIVGNLDSVDLTGPVLANNVLGGSVGIGERSLCAGHILTIHVDRHLVIGLADSSLML